MSLRTILSNPAEKPKSLLVLLHGYGADANDLAGLFSFYDHACPDMLCASIQSPHVCEDFAAGYQWYPMTDDFRRYLYTNNDSELKAFMDSVQPIREKVLSDLKDTLQKICEQHKIAPENVILAGFSQGAGMAFQLAQMIPNRGCVSFSGVLLPPYKIETPMMIVHGEADQVAPFHFMKQVKEKMQAGSDFEFHSLPYIAHQIPAEAIEKSIVFIKKTCAKI